MSSREFFLQRVRQAVADGNRAGLAPALPERGGLGYQGGGADPVQRFADELAAVGGQCHPVADADAARQKILDIVNARQPRRVLLGRGEHLDALGLAQALLEQGVNVQPVESGLPPDTPRAYFDADLAISGVTWLVAETGTVATATAPGDPRSVSLLPPLHIAVAHRSQLLPDLFDLFAELEKRRDTAGAPAVPSCLTVITGPSKTGDIELKLVTGVHGPGEIHVVLQLA